MLKAATMRPVDYLFATELANTMNWNMSTEDFAFNKALEPEGCFVLFDNSAPIGIATCISYERIGWFGNLIVKEESRKCGAGSFLVKHAVDYLHEKGVKTIGLYAYPHLVHFYGSLGFKEDTDFIMLKANGAKSSTSETPTPIQQYNLPEVTRFDEEYFGGNRERVLRSIIEKEGNVGYFIREDKKVVGYVLAKIFPGMVELGPLVCPQNRFDAATKLLNGLLAQTSGKEVYLCLPKNQTAMIRFLLDIGFEEELALVRMFLSKNPSKNCIYIAESLERG